MGDQQSAQRFILVSLNQNSTISSLLSETFHFVEQHCLTNATKSGQQKTLFRALLSHAGEQDASLLKDGVATHKFWWWGAGTG